MSLALILNQHMVRTAKETGATAIAEITFGTEKTISFGSYDVSIKPIQGVRKCMVNIYRADVRRVSAEIADLLEFRKLLANHVTPYEKLYGAMYK